MWKEKNMKKGKKRKNSVITLRADTLDYLKKKKSEYQKREGISHIIWDDFLKKLADIVRYN